MIWQLRFLILIGAMSAILFISQIISEVCDEKDSGNVFTFIIFTIIMWDWIARLCAV